MRLIVFENAAGVPIGFRHGFFAARKLSRFTAPAVPNTLSISAFGCLMLGSPLSLTLTIGRDPTAQFTLFASAVEEPTAGTIEYGRIAGNSKL